MVPTSTTAKVHIDLGHCHCHLPASSCTESIKADSRKQSYSARRGRQVTMAVTKIIVLAVVLVGTIVPSMAVMR